MSNIPRSGSGRQYGYGATKPKNTGYKGKGTVVPIKPPVKQVKIDKDGHVSV